MCRLESFQRMLYVRDVLMKRPLPTNFTEKQLAGIIRDAKTQYVLLGNKLYKKKIVKGERKRKPLAPAEGVPPSLWVEGVHVETYTEDTVKLCLCLLSEQEALSHVTKLHVSHGHARDPEINCEN